MAFASSPFAAVAAAAAAASAAAAAVVVVCFVLVLLRRFVCMYPKRSSCNSPSATTNPKP